MNKEEIEKKYKEIKLKVDSFEKLSTIEYLVYHLLSYGNTILCNENPKKYVDKLKEYDIKITYRRGRSYRQLFTLDNEPGENKKGLNEIDKGKYWVIEKI